MKITVQFMLLTILVTAFKKDLVSPKLAASTSLSGPSFRQLKDSRLVICDCNIVKTDSVTFV